jgi:tetratricopeptide (TPR) repeat protein
VSPIISFLPGTTSWHRVALLDGARTAALTGIAVLGTACSSYEGADTTSLLTITGGAVGAAIFFYARRGRTPVVANGVPAQLTGSNGSTVNTPEGEIEALTKAIELNPNDAAAYNARALAREKMRDPQGAVADFNHAIELDPNNARFFLWRGSAKYDCGDYLGAVDDHTRAIEINPDYASAYFYRALAEEGLGLYEEARRDYLAAKKRGGHSGVAIFADRGLRALEKTMERSDSLAVQPSDPAQSRAQD